MNYKVYGVLSLGLPYQQKNFLADAMFYVWTESPLYKLCGDGVYRGRSLKDEAPSVINHHYASTYNGHFGPHNTISKVL